jgi:hypothetical protein
VLLPNVAFLGHWGLDSGSAAGAAAHSHASAEAGVDEHDLHCHSGPASCTGGQATIGSINVSEDSGLITPQGTIIAILDSPAQAQPEPLAARLLRPPQVA